MFHVKGAMSVVQQFFTMIRFETNMTLNNDPMAKYT